MNIADTVRKQHSIAVRRGWSCMYWAIDLHSTLIKPTYGEHAAAFVDYYVGALPVMQALSQRLDVSMIVYTCSWPDEIERYLTTFSLDGIHFDWVNKNPAVDNTGYGCYQDKPYFNVLLDDKAGFEPERDWVRIGECLKTLPELEGNK